MSERRVTTQASDAPAPPPALCSPSSGDPVAGNTPPPVEEPISSSFGAVLANRHFLVLWLAQICSQLAQNLSWITLGGFVEHQTGKSTLVSVIIVSALLAQLFLSGFAGVVVDRRSKRQVLLSSNLARIVLTLSFIATTPLPIALQTTLIITLIFITNSIAQFFVPAESATIPLIVEKRNLLAASSLFNITLNACQVIPLTLGLLLYDLIGIVPVLILVASLYSIAAALVTLLPAQTAVAQPARNADSLAQTIAHMLSDVREALHFLAHDPSLRLTIFQVNVAPTFLFLFATLGYKFVQQTFGLDASRAWILLLPAGLGMVIGALLVNRVTARMRKQDVVNLGLVAMGTSVAVMGAVAVLVKHFNAAVDRIGSFITQHIHPLPSIPHDIAVLRSLIPPAMALALVLGVAISMSTIPAQTLVFERTSSEVRGRVLAMQQLIGGLVPIIPLLTLGPLADIVGTATVMSGLGFVILIAGAVGVHLDRGHRHRT